jgi:NADH-quinone oxidoreductase subunit H
MVTVSAVATDLFWAGGTGRSPESLRWIWFPAQVTRFCFLRVWMRWTLPRIPRPADGVGWKVLLPLAVVNLLVTAAGVLYFAA